MTTPRAEDLAYRGQSQGRRSTRVAYGLHVAAPHLRHLREELGAWRLVLPPGAAFTHLTAAELRGWWLPARISHPVFAAAAQDDYCPRRTGLLTTRHRLRPPAEDYEGVVLTSAAETLLAAARDLGVLDLVPLADSALRLGHLTVDELEATSRQRRRGAPMLRTVLPLLDKRSESPWESIMRVLHRAADVEVEPQFKVYDAENCFVGRADLWLVGTTRVHEYDGGGHRDPETHRQDLGRDRRFVSIGWERLGFTSSDLLDGGSGVIHAADQALGRPWDPRRLRRWNRLVESSLYSATGRVRALRRWGYAGPAKTGYR